MPHIHQHRFTVYRETTEQDKALEREASGDWRWSLKSINGKIIAEGGEGYEHGYDLVKSVRKYITRGHMLMESALDRALSRAGLDDRGRVRK